MPRFSSRKRSNVKRKLRYKRRLQSRYKRGRVTLRATAAKVRRLSRFVRTKAQYWQYKTGATVNLPVTAGTNLNAICLTSPNDFTPMWDAPSPTSTAHDKLGVSSLTVNCRVNIGTEADNCDNWIYIVRLKDSMTPYFDPSNGNLIMSNGIHYDMGVTPSGFNVVLNRKFFKVLKRRYAGTGDYGSYLTNTRTSYVSDRRFTFRFKRPFGKAVVCNESGAPWGDLECDRDPSSNLYMLTFTNNSAADGQSPNMTLSCMYNCYKCD